MLGFELHIMSLFPELHPSCSPFLCSQRTFSFFQSLSIANFDMYLHEVITLNLKWVDFSLFHFLKTQKVLLCIYQKNHCRTWPEILFFK